MCGFAGVYDAEGKRKYSMEELVRVILHRGPDQQKILDLDDRIHLGFARLSIIDLEGGAQPMSNADGSITVMCNGEIYNYLELKKKLQKEGCRFRSSSDTEVLLNMYEHHGISMLSEIQGMYGIAVIDRKAEVLYLARDRFGIKPLYYSCKKNGLIGFASEVKPLLKLPFVSGRISRKSVAEFLAWEYVQAPDTIFSDIRKVMPGHYLKLSADSFEDISYWDCCNIKEDSGLTVKECKDTVIRLLEESMELHLRSDVPLGVFLSGGIDSGLLAAFAGKKLPSLNTFTLKFEGGDFDESGLAELAAKKYHTNHHCYTVNADDFKRLLPQMIWYFDEPLGDSGMLPNYMLNGLAAKEGIRVILSGAGGDELFAGYSYYFENRKEHYMNSIPYFFGGIAKLVKNTAPGLSEKIVRSLSYCRDPFEHMLLCERAFDRESILCLSGTKADGLNKKRHYHKRCLAGGLNGMLYTDIKTYLADDLMLLSDRSCMAHSVEGRVPFLHHPLAEFALSIPDSIKAPGGQRKWLLREIAKEYLPAEILRAPKMGFCSPVQKWEKFGFGNFARHILNSERSIGREIWNTGEYRRFVSDQRNYRKNFQKIYLLLILELYFRIHADHTFESAQSVRQGDIYGQ